jgi:BASS family bile acid:Na+ symporter
LDIFITLFLPLALFIIMFSLGLGLVVDDFLRVFSAPRAFAVGIFTQMILLPVVGFVLAVAFRLPPELALGLVILALCPGGATSNILTKIAHGDVALSISLTAVSTLLSVVTIPLMVKAMAGYFLGVEAANIRITGLGLLLFALTALPVILGMTVRRFAPALTQAVERGLSRLALLLVVLAIAGALASNWSMFVDNLPVLGPSAIALNVVMLALILLIGWLMSLGEAQTSAIALETGIQNAAMGITVGSLIAERAGGVSPFSLPSGVYGIVMYGICVAFTLWRRGRAKSAQAA